MPTPELASRIAWRHVATHEMGSRRLEIYRDDGRGATMLRALNRASLNWHEGEVVYYADSADDFAPEGPYHTEDALLDRCE